MQEVITDDILFILGSAIVLAFIGAVILRKAGIPQTLGFMLAGIFLGLIGIISEDAINTLRIIVALALGLIGYNIGHELQSENLGGRVKKLIVIVIFEASAAFWLVTALIFLVTNQFHTAVLFGAVASATAPAATADVVWEHNTEGPLTSSLMFVLAADDAVAVILTNVAIAYALMFFTSGSTALFIVFLGPILKIAGSIIAGIIFGALFLRYVNRKKDRGEVLELEFGLVILLIGLSVVLELSEIFACMVFGYVVGKYISEDLEPVPVLLKKIMSPIIMIFFVIVGARMAHILTTAEAIIEVVIIATFYLIGRTVAKYVGTVIGATVVGEDIKLRKYLGTCLFCQAGVALGLSFLIEEIFYPLGGAAETTGVLVLSVVALSTMILEGLGPMAVKYSLQKAGEFPEVNICVVPESISYEMNEIADRTTSINQTDGVCPACGKPLDEHINFDSDPRYEEQYEE